MKKSRKNSNQKQLIIGIIFIAIVLVAGYFGIDIQKYVDTSYFDNTAQTQNVSSYDLSSIPEYNGSAYVVINDNVPDFSEEDYSTEAFEKYSKLDSLGRCGVAYANICRETMPKERRGKRGYKFCKTNGVDTEKI